MRNSILVFVPLLACSLAFGQAPSNSITVSASQNASLQPDQAIFSLTVQSGLNTGLDDVVAALQGSGITAANLVGIFSSTAPSQSFGLGQPALQWTFNLPVPLANTKATVASLTTLAQNIAKLNSGLTLAFTITGTQISQQLMQSQPCSLTGLISNATTQAQNMAAAAGVTLGPIIAMSGATSSCAITVRFSTTRY
jgi:uncharacterized protein YggE